MKIMCADVLRRRSIPKPRDRGMHGVGREKHWRSVLFRLLLVLTALLVTVSAPLSLAEDARTVESEEIESDKAQMRKVWEALMAFKRDKGQLPDYLSTLVPDYLAKEALVSPFQKRTGRKTNNGFDDPKLPCSYCYEFSGKEFYNRGITFAELKKLQVEEFGTIVPILRCFAYGKVLNVAYSGELFETQLNWETDPATKVLMEKLGLGPGFKGGAVTTVKVVDEDHKPVGNAEVRLSRRRIQGLSLPDRVVKTDEKGVVQVPLGATGKIAATVSAQVVKEGYYARLESWTQTAQAAERTISVIAAATIGGKIKSSDGHLLKNAQLTLRIPKLDNGGDMSPNVIAELKSDAEGQWRSSAVPRNFTELTIEVSHPEVSNKVFSIAPGPGEPGLSRDALLAREAELVLSPGPLITGTVIAPDGTPVQGAEVFISPLVLPESAEAAWLDETAGKMPLKTDREGKFSIKWKREERVVVTVIARDSAAAQTVEGAAPAMKSMRVVLAAGREISGRVTDYQGHPITDASVYLLTIAETGFPFRKQVASTNAQGQFSWRGAPVTKAALLVWKKGHAGALKDFRANAAPDTLIQMGPAAKGGD